MGVRETVSTWVENGGTPKYVLGMVLKLGVEIGFSVLLATTATPLFLLLLPDTALHTFLGSSTEAVVRFGLFGLIFKLIVFCTYTDSYAG